MNIKALLIYCLDVLDGYLHFPDPPVAPAAWQIPHWCETPLQQSGPPSVGSAAAAECLLDTQMLVKVHRSKTLPDFVCVMLSWHCWEQGLNSITLCYFYFSSCRYVRFVRFQRIHVKIILKIIKRVIRLNVII